VLKAHGHETRLHHMFGRYDVAPLRAVLEAWQPDVVGFTVVYPQWRFVKRVLADLSPWRAVTICGGAHPTVVPQCLEEVPELNAICVGEGEYPLLELVEALREGRSLESIPGLWVRRKDGTVVRNDPRPFIEDLDALPFYDREFVDYQAIIASDFKTATFQFGRGCPFDCSYCSNHVIRKRQHGPYVRFRSVTRSLEEIRRVVTRFQVKYLYLNDDTFMVTRSWFEEFCDRYPREFEYPIFVNARSEQINEDVCRRLAAARCQRVTIGIEHGNEAYRAEVLRRKMTNASIVRAFELCRQYGFKTKAHFLVGLPCETPELHRDTVRLAAQIQPDSFNLHIFEPYPGTRLGDLCWREGLIDREREAVEFVGQTDTVLRMPQFPRAEILRCFRRFAFRVYRRRSLLKAIPYYVYYSRWGEPLIRVLQPLKRVIRKFAMGV
jgi:radical SAM superfamily enzyme YgiQ (UPF0313 family)